MCKVKDVLPLSLVFSFHWNFTSSQRRHWHQHLGVITWPSSLLDVSQELQGPQLCNATVLCQDRRSTKCNLNITLGLFPARKKCGTEKQNICMFTGAKHISSLLVSPHYLQTLSAVWDLHTGDCYQLPHHSSEQSSLPSATRCTVLGVRAAPLIQKLPLALTSVT